ncbi:MAG: 50S ribosomal protein L24 [Lysobacterales bacterium]
MKRIKKGDDVIVISGRSKGVRGRVISVLENDRLLVENVNMVKKHVKPDMQKQIEGGIVSQEAPIHTSNVMLFNAQTNQADRVSFKNLEDGSKVRVYRSNGEVVDV